MAERGAWRHRSLARNVGPPLVLFVLVSAGIFTLAQLQLAEPSSGSGSKVVLGDATRGRAVFARTCASCHGADATGGVGPRLRGADVTIEAARETIRNGRGVMPAGLVSGREEDDVLAYLATIIEPGGGG